MEFCRKVCVRAVNAIDYKTVKSKYLRIKLKSISTNFALLPIQLQEIIQTDMKYKILEDILMENIQDYSEPINKAHDEITKKPYDHLDFRLILFYFSNLFLLLLIPLSLL